MKRLIVPLAVVAVLLVVAAPAGANSKPTTGAQIRLFNPPTTFPANTPFFVEQGFICPLGDGPCMHTEISAQSSITLYVDGSVEPSTVDIDVVGGSIEKRALTNFPNGLPAGVHTFVAVFEWDGSVSSVQATVNFT